MQPFIIGIGKETLEEDEKHWRKRSFAEFSLWPRSVQCISTGSKGTWSGRMYVHVHSPRKAAANRHIMECVGEMPRRAENLQQYLLWLPQDLFPEVVALPHWSQVIRIMQLAEEWEITQKPQPLRFKGKGTRVEEMFLWRSTDRERKPGS